MATNSTPPSSPAAPAAEAPVSSKKSDDRWGAHASKHWTKVPRVLLRFPKKLGLSRIDLLVVLNLLTYWGEDLPWPSKETIASALSIDPQTVRRSVKKMEGLGLVKRVIRRSKYGDNDTNKYDLGGLVKAVDKLTREENELRAKRSAEDKRRAATPKAAKLELVKGGAAKPSSADD